MKVPQCHNNEVLSAAAYNAPINGLAVFAICTTIDRHPNLRSRILNNVLFTLSTSLDYTKQPPLTAFTSGLTHICSFPLQERLAGKGIYFGILDLRLLDRRRSAWSTGLENLQNKEGTSHPFRVPSRSKPYIARCSI